MHLYKGLNIIILFSDIFCIKIIVSLKIAFNLFSGTNILVAGGEKQKDAYILTINFGENVEEGISINYMCLFM